MQAAPLQPLHLPLAGVVLLGLFIAWRMHSRIRKLLVRQPLRPWRTRLRAGLFVYVGVGLLFNLWGIWPSFASFAGAWLAGCALALLGLRMTRFEQMEDGPHYTPDLRIGIGLSLVLAVRVLWRLGEMALHGVPAHDTRMDNVLHGQTSPVVAELLHSPVTLAVLGLLAGYYAAYAMGLLWWRRRALRGENL